MKTSSAKLLILLLLLIITGCARDDEDDSSERRTAVTVKVAESRELERREVSVGRLETTSAPAVAAETAGRVARIHRDAGDQIEAGDLLAELEGQPQRIAVNAARAEVRRLQALLDNEQRRADRLTRLAERQSVAQDQLDEATTAVEGFEAQLESAQARLEDAEYNLERTRMISPVSGRVQRRMVSAGDFVSVGQVAFELVSDEKLRAILPLPEHLQDRIEPGLPVRLSIPARPDEAVDATLTELRPAVGERSRAIEVIVELDNPGSWRPGGSVKGEVIVSRHEAVVVSPASLVRRPAGQVVFVAEAGRALQREVETGLRTADHVEIVEGLEAGEKVVVDGAGFLSDDAAIEVRDEGAGS
ncbi:efflux RND transporter periplasmic adaptor subunit [Wenzhouxiangella sp. AB-CW3]|uniref:efflux RND transporter periplasmic adaptor subunit n=1 Tax=Wenzhouxiangella sp. AB-CW3 TaxID=2771012 RepID=UPI00168B38F5|nr:efflux RND transporter periplasmic adaptor subunit [Wenzhouxiangella sp. AB-CW3]QOC21516.1 efflux RND transporter periplasmic adaptor subunit [Wenzhouxiangella sp. AB-CW3]